MTQIRDNGRITLKELDRDSMGQDPIDGAIAGPDQGLIVARCPKSARGGFATHMHTHT